MSVRYEHDALGRLVAVTWSDGRPAWTCRYDALGRRVSSGFGEGAQTTFVWDGDRLAAEIAPNGRMRVYVYADHDALVPVGFVDDTTLIGGGRCAYTVHGDALGHPRVICDQAGEVVWTATPLDAYGTVAISDLGALGYNGRWPGHWWDDEIGLQYNRFRWYDVRAGRYLESDPMGTAGGVNLYACVANPTSAVDLLGLTGGCQDSQPPHAPGVGPEEAAESAAKPHDPSSVAAAPTLQAAQTPPPTVTKADLSAARQALQRAQAHKQNLPPALRKKCVASNGAVTLSGFKSGPTGVPGVVRVGPEDMLQHSATLKQYGYSPTSSGANDHDIPGQNAVTHTEKQLARYHELSNTNSPIGVTEEQCGDCRRWFRAQAQHTQAPLVVADPTFTRAYNPDGSVDVYDSTNNHVRTVPSSESPKASMQHYHGIDW